jgi:hypothetical protein
MSIKDELEIKYYQLPVILVAVYDGTDIIESKVRMDLLNQIKGQVASAAVDMPITGGAAAGLKGLMNAMLTQIENDNNIEPYTPPDV